MRARYRVNAPEVVHQSIDGEVIVIHLGHGHYFSLTGPGADIWRALDGGLDVDAIVAHVASAYDDAAAVDTGTRALVTSLVAEGLIVETDGESPPAASAPALLPAQARFEAPVLQKYTDMEQLLLLDPIHEVDDSGWPGKPRG